MANHESSRVVNYGAFGIVLSPALPNDPPYENDPHSMITKVFYHKEDYDALRKKKKRLAKILGVNEEGYRFQPYERTWQRRNLPSRAQEILSEEVENDEKTPFYGVRMLHLGTSVAALRVSPEGLAALRTCSMDAIVTAVQKVYRTLRALAQHHTLHGDIHAGNILVYLAPPYCDLSIIDYDRFGSYDEFKREYQEGRHDLYGGPEVMSLISEAQRDDPWILRAYLGRFLNNRYVDRVYPSGELDRRIREAAAAHGDKPIPFHTVDSFLLSPILLDLLYRVYPFLEDSLDSAPSSLSSQERQALRDMVEVLEEGFRFSPQRIGPEEIVTRLQRILCRLKGEPNHNRRQKNQEKNQEKNRCVVSGGRTRRKNKTKRRTTKTRIISRKGRR